MPQGISSAPKEYQRCQNEALAGLNGVEVIADDILCYGSGETMEDAVKDHDSNLLNLLDRAGFPIILFYCYKRRFYMK